MNYEQKIKEIEQEFNKNQQVIQELLARQEQLRGQYILLLDLLKENKEKDGKTKNNNK